MNRRMELRETVQAVIPSQELTKLQESAKSATGLPDKITTIVEAIHSGVTRNYTFYPAQHLESSVESWTKPYNKPVIKNHDIYEEPVGRVKSATYKQSQLSPDKQTIELELEITDPETIRKVMDGRYQTMSIGGSTKSAVCSICSKDMVKEGYCGHMKGRTYEGKQAYWIIGEMDFDEISWVNVPADSNAQVVNKNATVQTKESATTTEGGIQMADQHMTDDLLDQIDNLRTGESAGETKEPAVPVTEGAKGEEPKAEPEAGKQVEGAGETPEPTLQEQLDAANARVKELESENTALVANESTLNDQIGALTAERDSFKQQTESLQNELTIAENEVKTQVSRNVSLASYTHKVLAESAARMQVVTGKIEESKLEETIAEFSKETSRSLKEKLVELTSEKPQRVIQHVEHPAAEQLGEGAIAESANQEKPQPMTVEEYAAKLNKIFNKSN